MINWNKLSEEDSQIIHKIAKRTVKQFIKEIDLLTVDMSVGACHISNPLKLQELLEADDFNFVHDVTGIIRHINRQTGKLENCFLPRFSA